MATGKKKAKKSAKAKGNKNDDSANRTLQES